MFIYCFVGHISHMTTYAKTHQCDFFLLRHPNPLCSLSAHRRKILQFGPLSYSLFETERSVTCLIYIYMCVCVCAFFSLCSGSGIIRLNQLCVHKCANVQIWVILLEKKIGFSYWTCECCHNQKVGYFFHNFRWQSNSHFLSVSVMIFFIRFSHCFQ